MSEVPDMLPFAAVGWRIIVEPFAPKTKTDGGLALPDESVEVQKANEYRGRVVSVGALAYRDPGKFKPNGERHNAWCAVGDVVAYNRYAGQKMHMEDGREFRVLNDEDILATIGEPDRMKNPY